jgi:hypothetical protein
MLAYAGIGSRTISEEEKISISKISEKLHKKFILYSGNCEGADVEFQKSSNKNCVLFLPWKSFNIEQYPLYDCLHWYDMGHSEDGNKSIEKYHPNPKALTKGGRLLMSRNYHQIYGYDKYPIVSFVVFCADEDRNGNVSGGTSFAVKIARDLSIPTCNIRQKGWQNKLSDIVKSAINKPS